MANIPGHAAAESDSPKGPRRALSLDSASPTARTFSGESLEILFGTNFQPSAELVKAIEAKRCIAFVGAGFTAPITQLTWKSLLIKMLEKYENKFKERKLEALYAELLTKLNPAHVANKPVPAPSAEDYALVAQEIQDILGEEEFEKFVQSMCKLNGNTTISAEMVHRIRCLSRIPFKAIVTTNYNSVFCGLADNVEPALHNGFVNPCKMWESILRGSSGAHDLLDDQEELVHGAAHGDQDSAENKSLLDDAEECAEVSEEMTLKAALDKYKFRCPILKIHGCVEYPNSIVLSRRGYKRLQYETPGFKMFLTSAMATNTMLYIGFSFTDDYLNEFRAEVLKMLRPSPRLPMQFNLVFDALRVINKTSLLCEFFERRVHDDMLQDLKEGSLRRETVRAHLVEILRNEADVAAIEEHMKTCVIASQRLQSDFADLNQSPPIAYAIIDNKSKQQIDYYKRHEGVQMMTWNAHGGEQPWYGGLGTYLDGILRQTSRPFLWGRLLTDSVLEKDRVIITWDLGNDKNKWVSFWLKSCVKFYRNASRHHNSLYTEAKKREKILHQHQKMHRSHSERGLSVVSEHAEFEDQTEPVSALNWQPSDHAVSPIGAKSRPFQDVVKEVKDIDELHEALMEYRERVACVICPFGLTDQLLMEVNGFSTMEELKAAKDELRAKKSAVTTPNPSAVPTPNLYDTLYDLKAQGRWEAFMKADHIVRLVQKQMASIPPQFQCPFIVYGNPQKDRVADCWRQECAMRCGAFGFACRTDKLFDLIKSIADTFVYSPHQPPLPPTP